MASSDIQRLPNDVIDQIAAGEVIERPASVVKELLENAIDAGASAVQIDLVAGGLERMTISDDGRGMSPDDLELCIERHATSKLRSSEQLFSIATLGFRGEALSSIAAVSHLTITTRRESDRLGRRLSVEGGSSLELRDVGGPVGTTVDVRELFYNTPARRKFMRSPATEQAHCVDWALRVVLGARRGGVVVTSGTRRLLDIPEDQQELERVKAAFGPRVRQLRPFDRCREGVKVSGFLATSEATRGDSRGIWFFVNGRFVRDRMLQRALIEVCRPFIAPGRFPIAVVYVDLDSGAVDINVHPQKLEVRFSDSASVYRQVTAALTDAVAALEQSAVPMAVSRAPKMPDVPTPTPGTGRHTRPKVADKRRGDPPYIPRTPEITPELPFRSTGPGHRSVGRRWCVEERGADLVVVDLYRAAAVEVEEELRDALAAGQCVEAARLLLPVAIDGQGRAGEWLDENFESLARYGIELEPVGPERFLLKAVPVPLKSVEPASILRALLPILSEGPSPTLDAEAGLLVATLARLAGPVAAEQDGLAERWRSRDSDRDAVFRIESDRLAHWLRDG